jgi:hypothetical protein
MYRKSCKLDMERFQILRWLLKATAESEFMRVRTFCPFLTCCTRSGGLRKRDRTCSLIVGEGITDGEEYPLGFFNRIERNAFSSTPTLRESCSFSDFFSPRQDLVEFSKSLI